MNESDLWINVHRAEHEIAHIEQVLSLIGQLLADGVLCRELSIDLIKTNELKSSYTERLQTARMEYTNAGIACAAYLAIRDGDRPWFRDKDGTRIKAAMEFLLQSDSI